MIEQTYTNAKGVTKPLYAIDTLHEPRGATYRVMVRGRQVAAYTKKGLALAHVAKLKSGDL